MRKKRERFVHETESDAYSVKQMQERIKELERAVGQKQLKIDFLEKMIEIAEDDLKIDIKKKITYKLFISIVKRLSCNQCGQKG
jgi:hypothetical protein